MKTLSEKSYKGEYEVPTVVVVEIKYEGVICSTGDPKAGIESMGNPEDI